MSRISLQALGLGLVVALTTLALSWASPALAQEEKPAAATEAKSEETKPEEAKPEEAKTEEAKTEEAKTETPAAVVSTGPTTHEVAYTVDNIVLMICAVLVIFMQAGFALVEVGLNAAKNAVNILFKNLVDFALGAILFFLVGYGLMFPGESYAGKWFGFSQMGISDQLPPVEANKFNPQVYFLFQVAFAATAATIVSGAVAGRIKFSAYLIYTMVITAFVYPISGMWKWGGGWLQANNFFDFAGSVVVHAVGGFAGLAGAIMLGPRIGRYVKGKVMPMPGHNLTFAALGVFILLIGWYGFNPGSQLAFVGAANTNTTVTVATNTTLAGCAGCVVGMLVSWVLFKKPDLTMALNGTLAGLVGITANCDQVSNMNSLVIGAIAGVLVVLAILVLDKLRIDDPVGAFPVHGVCGMWGGIATGIFGTNPAVTLGMQIKGTLLISGWSFGTMLVVFGVLRVIGLLRVTPEEEMAGLDISEHGMHAYPPHLVADDFGGSPMAAASALGYQTAPAMQMSAEGA